MESEVPIQTRPKGVLEVAGAIVSFARSLSSETEVLSAALRVARDAIETDDVTQMRRFMSGRSDHSDVR